MFCESDLIDGSIDFLNNFDLQHNPISQGDTFLLKIIETIITSSVIDILDKNKHPTSGMWFFIIEFTSKPLKQ